MDPVATFRFDNSFARELEGLYVPWRPAAVPAPRLLFFNHALAAELGLDVASFDGPAGAATFAGNTVPEGAEPIAQAYAGHQFGGFSPQLGDGRALLLGEVIDRQGRRRDIALKGSGRTPFARGGDGKAAVGPMLREVLLGEAMHALGIPTTRALAVVATGEPVYREHELPGAVLTRVAASHIRVGTFEFFARSVEVVCTIEDHVLHNGFGCAVMEHLYSQGMHTPVVRIGWPDEFIEHGTIPILRKKHGITADALVEKVLPLLRKKSSLRPSVA